MPSAQAFCQISFPRGKLIDSKRNRREKNTMTIITPYQIVEELFRNIGGSTKQAIYGKTFIFMPCITIV
jgi:DNA replication protein DnaC